MKSSQNIVRHNTMRATNGEFTLRHGNGNQVYGNYILGVSGADASSSKGMRVYGADHRIFNNYIHVNGTGIQLDDGSSDLTDEPGKQHYSVWRAWVYNNTVIGKTIKFGGSKAFNPRDCRAANNIVSGSIQVDRRHHHRARRATRGRQSAELGRATARMPPTPAGPRTTRSTPASTACSTTSRASPASVTDRAPTNSPPPP